MFVVQRCPECLMKLYQRWVYGSGGYWRKKRPGGHEDVLFGQGYKMQERQHEKYLDTRPGLYLCHMSLWT